MQISDFLKSEASLKEALTHRSYCNEHPGTAPNERLEFLGDSVLSVVISDRLFRLLPEAPEGELTARRSNLVQTNSLAEKSAELGFDSLMLLSKGEEDSGGRKNHGLLANTFEAVLGAIFIDSGIEACYRFLEEVFPDSEILSEKISSKDPKSLLQEYSQSQGSGTPLYQIISATGPDHAKLFVISVSLNGTEKGRGEGPSKQKAETQAAQDAISKLFPTATL
jgi:ribonuclease-3